MNNQGARRKTSNYHGYKTKSSNQRAILKSSIKKTQQRPVIPETLFDLLPPEIMLKILEYSIRDQGPVQTTHIPEDLYKVETSIFTRDWNHFQVGNFIFS